MITIILMALLLALLQIWIIPMTGAMAINIKTIFYLFSNRDKDIKIDPASTTARILRASSNLQESLPAFLALATLSIIAEVDNTMFAMTWLFLRVLYFLVYAAGIPYIRSVIWIGSIACLVLMGLALI
jgi:uncharacterized MAPEG superfamily protein